MLDLQIDRLQLNITNATGHEDRLQPIVLRAVDLLASGLDKHGGRGQGGALNALDAPTVSLDLDRMTDAEAAQTIANAWLEALALTLNV